MPRKKIIERRIRRLEEKRNDIKSKVDNSTDVNEVRSLTTELQDIIDELNDLKDELAELENDDNNDNSNNDNQDNSRSNFNVNDNIVNDNIANNVRAIPKGATLVNGDITNVASFKTTRSDSDEDMFASLEYRKAFMQYAQRGIAIPDKFQKRDSAANTNTLGAIIPTTLLNEFINEVKLRYGNLYSKIRRLNIQGNLRVPIAKLEADFKWISEDTVSPRTDAGTFNDYVQFSFNTAEIRVSQTLVSSIVTLDLFEREIVEIMMIAYLKAMDEGIVKGTGNGQMLGIINDPRVLATGNVVEFTSDEINNWTEWRKNFFSKLPLGYRAGEFIFPLSTVESYLATMADNNNNPIFRQATGLEVRDGDVKNPNGRFFGRDISLVEPNILPDFDSAENGDVIGIYWQPQEYAINTNMQFTMRRYFDEERNEWVNKILTIVDGKVLNPKGIWLIKKKISG